VSPRESKVYGVNRVGLERAGFAAETIERLHRAFRLLGSPKLNTTQAIEQIEAELAGCPEVEELLAFIRGAERGFIK